MPFDLEEQVLLEDSHRRAQTSLPAREWISEAALALAFIAVAAIVWWLQPPTHVKVLPVAFCVLVFVVAGRVRFMTVFGFTVATQLAFVPLAFATPAGLIAPAVLVGLIAPEAINVVAGRALPRRLLLSFGNAWFCLGPALVLAAADTGPQRASAGLLLLALGAQFAVDICVSVLRFWIDRDATLAEQLHDSWVYAVDAALTLIALPVAQDLPHLTIASLAPLPLLGLLAVFARERQERVDGLLELSTAYRGTALVLGDVVEADDGYTGEHCRGVVALALAVGKRLGLTAEQTRNLEFGALLHDVGKITIPKSIINKTGPLDATEWELMKTHTVAGQEMLDRIGGFMVQVGLIVRSHHERWDGAGYPDGLAAEAIPLESRIISACDAWNAMRTDRAYRTALPYEVARAEIANVAGHQLDPAVAAALLDAVRDEETEAVFLRPSAPGAAVAA